jgi:excisionase family DNA binding protein
MAREDNNNAAPSSRLLTVSEVSHLLHVHPNTVRLWSKIGVLKSYRIGKRRDYRFDPRDIATFLYNNGSEP